MRLITRQNLEQDLSELFQNDEDFNGNNGEEFTSDLALENGFESDLSYYVSKAMEKFEQTDDLKQSFDVLFNGFGQLNCNFYDIDFDSKYVGEDLMVSIQLDQYQ